MIKYRKGQLWEGVFEVFHIALCDDEAAQRQLTHKLLDSYFSSRGAAAKIWEFSDGQGLLNAMLDETFDLYLLDIVMPEMDGIDLGMELRKSDENGSLSISPPRRILRWRGIRSRQHPICSNLYRKKSCSPCWMTHSKPYLTAVHRA